MVLEFRNDEWSAWSFMVCAKGKEIAQGIFGEKAESGISLEDNCLEGDLDAAASLLGCDVKKLKSVVNADDPDVEKFIKAVGFGRYSITPYELDRETRGEARAVRSEAEAARSKEIGEETRDQATGGKETRDQATGGKETGAQARGQEPRGEAQEALLVNVGVRLLGALDLLQPIEREAKRDQRIRSREPLGGGASYASA